MKVVKVIYITGDGRSGSTLLDRILGTLDGVSSFNEIKQLWTRGFVRNLPCSCGERFNECPFWIAVFSEMFRGSDSQSEIRRILALQNSVDMTRYFPKLYIGVYNDIFQKKLAEYRDVLRRLYFAIARVSGCEIIVDSSKHAVRALILADIPDIDVHIIHLVRDVRAVVYAYKKRNFIVPTGRWSRTYPAPRTVLAWLVRNIFSELLATRLPYIKILYEDFARHPRRVLQELVEEIGPIAGKQVPFVNEDTIYLGRIHSMSGNRSRFSFGTTRVRLDDDWVTRLNSTIRHLITLLAYPMIAHYGYTEKDFFRQREKSELGHKEKERRFIFKS